MTGTTVQIVYLQKLSIPDPGRLKHSLLSVIKANKGSMDPLYLQGLREAKGLLDEGVFSPEVMRLLLCCSGTASQQRRHVRRAHHFVRRSLIAKRRNSQPSATPGKWLRRFGPPGATAPFLRRQHCSLSAAPPHTSSSGAALLPSFCHAEAFDPPRPRRHS